MLTKLPIIGKKITSLDPHMREIVHGAGTAFAFRLLGTISQFVFGIVLARLYGADGMGIYTIAFTITALAAIISRAGMDQTILKLIAVYADNGELRRIKGIFLQALLVSATLSVFITTLIYFCAPWFSMAVYHQQELIIPIQIMAFSILPFALLNLIAESLRALKLIKFSSLVQSVFTPFLSVVLIIVFYYLDFNIIGSVLAYFIATLITFLLAFLIWVKAVPVFMDKNTPPVHIPYRELFHTAIPMAGISLLVVIFSIIDTTILGILRPADDVGIYNAALKTALLTSFILVAVNSISAPKFAVLHKNNDISSLEKVAVNSTKLMILFSAPMLIFFILFSPLVMGLYGHEFIHEGAIALIIISVGQFVNVATGSVGFLLLMTGHERILRTINIITILIDVALCFLLIPDYGIIGAAISVAAALVFQNLSATFVVWKKLNIITIPFIKIPERTS